MALGDELAYLLRRAIPDALDPTVRRAVGSVIPREGDGGRFKIIHAGTFSSRVAADLLAFGRNQRFDGALIVIDEDVLRAIHFKGGRVVGAESDFLFERMGRVLRRGDLVDDAAMRTLVDLEEHSGMAAVLAQVPADAALWGLETRVWDIVAALFLVRQGHFLFVEGEPRLGEVPEVDLSPMDLAIEGLRRYDEWRHGSTGVPTPVREEPAARPPETPARGAASSAAGEPLTVEQLLAQIRALGEAV